MKNLLLLISILALLLLPIGCVDTEQIAQDWVDRMTLHTTGTYTIKVGGTAGLYFTGEYQVNFLEYDLAADDVSIHWNAYTTEGVVPREYTFEAMVAGGFFQKQIGANQTPHSLGEIYLIIRK